ncbi:UBX domain protein Ubx2 [Friedmanniomyces endolithicus]|nr:UBX domain protein Ubx2 [Friedmanniomyces endolithicus]KAK0355894.1 UBX domain protein Ubx2 [Friedmanniomyces endolithicus]KAK0792492.1 UBX domain protein Ubx2 [Friedmanniomyces endolithicus]KAK0813973.1 UBX domain protein Ubx2 [Friedmanniomyces endolithicus]KAK0861143.1 UBX domain protein Ubx2 [Friedmanniomyces endolithicus]
MDEQISTFVAFTDGTPAQAQQYLALTDGNVEQAVELFFSNPDLGATAAAPSQPARQQSSRDHPINLDDDDEVEDPGDDVQMTGSGPVAHAGHSVEDDEAMARRLQEEMYGVGGGGGGAGGRGEDVDAEGVRAPMARTTETLVGPDADWGNNDDDAMNAAVFEQLAQRRMGGGRGGRGGHSGIFNQAQSSSIWSQDDPNDPDVHRQVLSRATGGASDSSAKSNLLAELFKPPIELICRLPWVEARDEGKDTQKWLLVNVQDPSIFDCQVLNRDIWKNRQIRDTINEHFIFLQYNKGDPRGKDYFQYYFANMQDSEDSYPHIGIVDPRTGEQVKTWSGSPAPKAADFLMDLHEFLDRYSLSMERKNPVQAKRKEKKKDVAQMSEEEMLEMALQNSLANGGEAASPVDEDPDALTKPATASTNGKGKERLADAMDTSDMGTVASHSNGTDPEQPASGSLAAPAPDKDTPFSRISSTNPHTEPTSTGPETTRIQFRYSGGRVVRRFALSDPVRRIYEWLKAEPPFEGKGGEGFELISMGRNLIEGLEVAIGEAGLRNGTVMVEFVRGDEEDE